MVTIDNEEGKNQKVDSRRRTKGGYSVCVNESEHTQRSRETYKQWPYRVLQRTSGVEKKKKGEMREVYVRVGVSSEVVQEHTTTQGVPVKVDFREKTRVDFP